MKNNKNILNINNLSGKIATYTLLDLSGRPIFSIESSDANVSMDLSKFSSGNYFVNIEGFGLTVTVTNSGFPGQPFKTGVT